MQMLKRALAGMSNQEFLSLFIAVGRNRSPALTCCVQGLLLPHQFCDCKDKDKSVMPRGGRMTL